MEIFTVKDLSKLIKEKRLALGMTQSDASALCKVGFPFSNSDKNLIPTLQSAEASDCVIPRAKRFSFINFDRSLTVKISIK